MRPAAKRGRILKAPSVKVGAKPVAWRDPASEPSEQGSVELVRDGDRIVAVRVFCSCGKRHDLSFEEEEKEQTS